MNPDSGIALSALGQGSHLVRGARPAEARPAEGGSLPMGLAAGPLDCDVSMSYLLYGPLVRQWRHM